MFFACFKITLVKLFSLFICLFVYLFLIYFILLIGLNSRINSLRQMAIYLYHIHIKIFYHNSKENEIKKN